MRTSHVMTARVAQGSNVTCFSKSCPISSGSSDFLLTNLFSDATFRISTPLTGIRRNPCATPPWGGTYGHLANPTPDTSYEPKFCIDVSNEHTPINLPDSNRNFSHDYDATEDLDLPRYSGASSSSQHSAAASRVPTVSKLGSL